MGLLGSLFGKAAKSSSNNQAFGAINENIAPTLGTTSNVFNQAAGELAGGFDQFKKNSGFDFMLNKGTRDRVGAGAAKGLLNSGPTSRSLAKYETDLGSQSYGNFFNNLMQTLQGGTGLGSLLANAGQTSTSKGATGGIVGGLQSIFSDRRLKENIVVVGKLDNGLPVYSYNYIGDRMPQIGLMADDVEALHPDAVSVAQGGYRAGYSMVDYGKAVL